MGKYSDTLLQGSQDQQAGDPPPTQGKYSIPILGGEEIAGKGYSHPVKKAVFPELPLAMEEIRNPKGRAHTFDNPQFAKTPSGMANILRKKYPKAELDLTDEGEPLFILNEPIGDYGPEQRFVMNAPGPSMQDLGLVENIGVRSAPAIAGSYATAGMGPIAGMMSAGVGGITGEGAGQGVASLAGAEEGFSLTDMFLAGGFAAAGEGVGRIMSKMVGGTYNVFKKLGGKLRDRNPFDETGAIKPEVLKHLKKRGISPSDFRKMALRDMNSRGDDVLREYDAAGLTPAEQARTVKIKAQNIEPTKANITRKGVDYLDQQDLARSGNQEVVDRLNQQNTQLLSNADDISVATGGRGLDTGTRNQSVLDAVDETSKLNNKYVSQLYKEIRDGIDDDTSIYLKGLNDQLDDLDIEATAKGYQHVIDASKKLLKKYEVIDGDGNITGPVTVKKAEELRQRFNDFYEPGNREKNILLEKIKDLIDQDVIAAAKTDAFSPARKAAYLNFKEFTTKKGAQRIVAKMLDDNTFSEDVFQRAIISGKADELKSLKNALLNDGKVVSVDGMAAWNNLRRQTVEYIIKQATKGVQLDELGNPIFNGGNWVKAVEKLTQHGPQKMKTLFSNAEWKEIVDIGDTAVLLKPPPMGAMGSTTDSNIFIRAMKLLEKLPGGTATGNIARGVGQTYKQGAAGGEAHKAIQAPVKALAQARKPILPPTRRIITPPSIAGSIGSYNELAKWNNAKREKNNVLAQ